MVDIPPAARGEVRRVAAELGDLCPGWFSERLDGRLVARRLEALSDYQRGHGCLDETTKRCSPRCGACCRARWRGRASTPARSGSSAATAWRSSRTDARCSPASADSPCPGRRHRPRRPAGRTSGTVRRPGRRTGGPPRRRDASPRGAGTTTRSSRRPTGFADSSADAARFSAEWTRPAERAVPGHRRISGCCHVTGSWGRPAPSTGADACASSAATPRGRTSTTSPAMWSRAS